MCVELTLAHNFNTEGGSRPSRGGSEGALGDAKDRSKIRPGVWADVHKRELGRRVAFNVEGCR